jgi:hypothetical protein
VKLTGLHIQEIFQNQQRILKVKVNHHNSVETIQEQTNLRLCF